MKNKKQTELSIHTQHDGIDIEWHTMTPAHLQTSQSSPDQPTDRIKAMSC
ncbi:MAG: hypothetical protein WCF23_14910 [Candidatus Nitrosopolaris sp.]